MLYANNNDVVNHVINSNDKRNDNNKNLMNMNNNINKH